MIVVETHNGSCAEPSASGIIPFRDPDSCVQENIYQYGQRNERRYMNAGQTVAEHHIHLPQRRGAHLYRISQHFWFIGGPRETQIQKRFDVDSMPTRDVHR